MRPQLENGTLGRPMAMGDLKAAQRALAQYMSDLSEEAYSAGWMNGLEDALWEVVLGDRREYSHATFTDEHAVELRRLSACGGWIVFDDSREETWVSLAEWQTRFQGRKSTGVAADIRMRTSPLQAQNTPYSRAELLAAEELTLSHGLALRAAEPSVAADGLVDPRRVGPLHERGAQSKASSSARPAPKR